MFHRVRRAIRLRRPALFLAAGAVAASTVLLPTPAQAHTSESAVVRTDNGALRGESTDEGRQFLGVPYAKAPVGDLRWKAPEPAGPWLGVKDATEFGDRCAQNTYWAPGYETRRTTEDCLNLNVFTPKSNRGKAKPVLVWIHGGANIGGGSPDAVPDEFADRTDSIVVTVNYRLGALGFLSLPGTTGNFALLDQQQALRWVQGNIGRFGGDARKVTVGGESAGGFSVCSQLASPSARGLFRAAIIQSGDCGALSRTQGDKNSLDYAAKAGCTDARTALACLRGKSTAEILDAQQGIMMWNSVADGKVLPQTPAAAIAAGRASRVPVLIGANSREGRVFTYDSFDRWGQPLTAEGYPAALKAAFGEQSVAQLQKLYPLGAYERPAYAYAAAMGDQMFACSALRNGASLGERGRTYAYEFDDRTSPLFASLPQNADFDLGATHAAELSYLFKPYGEKIRMNSQQRALSRQMTDYWGDFIRTGHVDDLPDQSRKPGKVLQLRTKAAGGNTVNRNLRAEHRCDFWDSRA